MQEKVFTQLSILSTVSKIYTPIFSFFWKKVGSITIKELGPVSNESLGNSALHTKWVISNFEIHISFSK